MLSPLAAAVAAAIFLCATTASAQQTTTPAISDSPTAQTLFDDIRSQARENPGESARLARRLLDEYGNRVVRIGVASDDLFNSVAAQTERFLLANPIVLARFRDMESRAAERMLREDGPAATAARRRLTPAGLSASLMLAEDALRADRPLEAITLLDEVAQHPDLLGSEAVAHATLEAMARRRMGDGAGADAAIARLVALAGGVDGGVGGGVAVGVDAETIARARAAAERTARATGGGAGRSPLTTAPDGGNPDETWRQIWSLELDQSLYHRLFGGNSSARQQRDLDRARTEATVMTAVPTVLGNRIFICEGHRVRAVDLDSRDELWTREIGSIGIERESGTVADLSAIVADEGALIVYEGHAFASGRSATARVWCLDPATGVIKWNTVVDGCDGRADLAGLFPVGTPLLVSDVVVVAARKPTQRLEQVDWLLALDRRDGHLRWATSVAGAPSNRGSVGRKNAGLATDDSIVIDSTPLGAVVCVKAADGAIEWLRRFPVPLREPRYFAEPWEMSSPAIIADRVIAITPDELEVVALDRATGRLFESQPIGPDTAWASPNYLVSAVSSSSAGGADATPIVLSVGSNIVAFDARDLRKRLWSLSDTIATLSPPRPGALIRNGIRGRVSVAGQYVVVPGLEDILLLELATGKLNARIPSERPCNPLLLSDRIVAAGDDALRVIMPSERAESMLRARLAASPDDPSAAIALLELANATGRPSVAIDAARTAAKALGDARGRVPGQVQVQGNDSLRAELIDKLVSLAQQHPDKGDEVYRIVAQVSDTPMLRVGAEMARGDFLRTAGRATEAVECWRAVAADPTLLSQLVVTSGSADPADATVGATVGASVGATVGMGGGATGDATGGVGDSMSDGPVMDRQVRLEALARVAQLASRDRDIASALEADARAARDRLGATPTDNQLAAFVRTHSRTQSAVDAIAAQPSPAPSFATDVTIAAIVDCLLPPARVDLIDALRADLARRGEVSATQRAAMDDRIGQLLVASGIDRPDLHAPPAPLAVLGATATVGIDLRARLVSETATVRQTRDRTLILGLLDGALTRLSGPELAPQWRLRVDDRDPVLLWANKRVVLWQTLAKGEDNGVIIDPASGTIVYTSPRPADLWPNSAEAAPKSEPAALEPAPAGQPIDRQLPNLDVQLPNAPRPNAPPTNAPPIRGFLVDGNQQPAVSAMVLPICDGESLILARRNGDIARVGVMDEHPSALLARGVLAQIFAENLHDGLLTLGGRESSADGPRPMVVVLDARTLHPRLRIAPITRGDVKWAFATALGEVFIATKGGIERWTTSATGEALPTFVSTGSETTESERPCLLGAHIFAVDGGGRPTLTPIFAGATRSYIFPDAADARQLRDQHLLREGLLLQADDRFVLLGPHGDTIGLDSSARDATLGFAIPIEGALLQVNALEPDADAGKLRYQSGCVIERLSPAKGLRNEGGAFEVKALDSRVSRVLAADGWLLLSNVQGTMAVAMPANANSVAPVAPLAPVRPSQNDDQIAPKSP